MAYNTFTRTCFQLKCMCRLYWQEWCCCQCSIKQCSSSSVKVLKVLQCLWYRILPKCFDVMIAEYLKVGFVVSTNNFYTWSCSISVLCRWSGQELWKDSYYCLRFERISSLVPFPPANERPSDLDGYNKSYGISSQARCSLWLCCQQCRWKATSYKTSVGTSKLRNAMVPQDSGSSSLSIALVPLT